MHLIRTLKKPVDSGTIPHCPGGYTLRPGVLDRSMMIQPRTPTQPWKTTPHPTAYSCVLGLCITPTGELPLVWRTDKVRSAKNCFSSISGLHECGLTAAEQLVAEGFEELNLHVELASVKHVGFYENIDLDGGWHWALQILTARIPTIETITNKEPDKHVMHVKQIDLANPRESLRKVLLSECSPWSPGFEPFLVANFDRVADNLIEILKTS